MSYSLYFDGGSRGNPGHAGSGYVIKSESGTIVISGSIYCGINTNNFAEYTGLLEGLKAIKTLNPTSIKIYGDSLLVVNQINGKYKVNAPNLIPLYRQCVELLKNIKFEISHIARSLNKEADEMANKAMDEKK